MRLAILLSGRGSNFAAIEQAIAERRLDATIVAVISNKATAAGIVHARLRGLPAHVVEHRLFPTREEHERGVRDILDASSPDLIVLAGYMRLLSPPFIAAFRNRIVNIHPSLLPSFPGVDAQAQAIEHGVKVSGCTVHFVDEHLDAGPIIVQRTVEVLDTDDAATLSARILHEEHAAYVDALQLLSSRRYVIEGRRVIFESP